MVEEDGNAPSLAEGHSAVRLVHYSPMKGSNWLQGRELHPPSPAYETERSSGSPCCLKRPTKNTGTATAGRLAAFEVVAVRPVFRGHDWLKWCGVTVMLRVVSGSSGVTVRTVSLAGYRRT